MTDRTLYTRVYSSTSAGTLVSARGTSGRRLSIDDLLDNFRLHSNSRNRIPTALVSVSRRIVDTLKRAFDKYLRGEDPNDIRIVFIEFPQNRCRPVPRTHRAHELAEACGYRNFTSFYHEVLFEWAIPQSYVIHEVPLATVMDHPWCLDEYFVQSASTQEVRDRIANDFKFQHSRDSGYSLGRFAWAFGAEAPVEWIAHRLFWDCVPMRDLEDEDGQHILDGIEEGLVEGSFAQDEGDVLSVQSYGEDDYYLGSQESWVERQQDTYDLHHYGP